MGTKNLKKNLSNLISNGMPKKTNIAVINWGTYSKQKTVTGNLINIHEEIQKNKIKSPSIVVIGDICKMRSKLNWFEKKPLFGISALPGCGKTSFGKWLEASAKEIGISLKVLSFLLNLL